MSAGKEQRRSISSHFRREAKLMLAMTVGIVALGVLAVIVAPRIKQFIAVDRCLDAGSAYNYSTHGCESPENQHVE